MPIQSGVGWDCESENAVVTNQIHRTVHVTGGNTTRANTVHHDVSYASHQEYNRKEKEYLMSAYKCCFGEFLNLVTINTDCILA